MKQVVILNLINLVLFGLVAVCAFVIPLPIALIFGIVVLIFAIYSNYVLLIRNSDDDYLLKQADKKGIFKNEVKGFITQHQSLEEREKVIEGDEKLQEVYDLVSRKVDANIDSAIKFMEMYDYIQRPDASYLHNLYQENQQLLRSLNEVVEQFIRLESSVHDVDTSYVDDLLVSLKEMAANEEK